MPPYEHAYKEILLLVADYGAYASNTASYGVEGGLTEKPNIVNKYLHIHIHALFEAHGRNQEQKLATVHLYKEMLS